MHLRIVLVSSIVLMSIGSSYACSAGNTNGPSVDGGFPDTGVSTIDANNVSSSCGNTIPSTATDTAAIALIGVDVGEASPTGWKSLGYNIDGLCTTSQSTDVCTQASGAQKSAQADGLNGIDNGFGNNLLPIFDSVQPEAFAQGSFTLNITAGTGALTFVGNGAPLQFPLAHAKVVTNGTGGTLSAIIPAAQFIAAFNAYAGRLSTSLCNGSATAQIDAELEQASDINTDGTNESGSPCDGISLGLTFTSTANAGPAPDPGPDPCAGGDFDGG